MEHVIHEEVVIMNQFGIWRRGGIFVQSLRMGQLRTEGVLVGTRVERRSSFPKSLVTLSSIRASQPNSLSHFHVVGTEGLKLTLKLINPVWKTGVSEAHPRVQENMSFPVSLSFLGS